MVLWWYFLTILMSFAVGFWMICLSLKYTTEQLHILDCRKSHAMSICVFFQQVWHPCINLVVQLNYITRFSVMKMCQQFVLCTNISSFYTVSVIAKTYERNLQPTLSYLYSSFEYTITCLIVQPAANPPPHQGVPFFMFLLYFFSA